MDNLYPNIEVVAAISAPILQIIPIAEHNIF